MNRCLYLKVGLKWLVFFIGPLHLIDMWFGEDQRTNIVRTTCSKEIDWTTVSNINNMLNTR